jgi:glycine oxidase
VTERVGDVLGIDEPTALEQYPALWREEIVAGRERVFVTLRGTKTIDERNVRYLDRSDAFDDAEDTPTFKPNFVSVMNCKYQIPGVQVASAIGDPATTIVVNCAGAWAGGIGPHPFPVRPVKGQMLDVVGGPSLKHVVRAEKVYLVPRSGGRLVIGSTLEEAGYDKRIDINTIQQLFHVAVEVMPGLAQSKVHENWAGLRPGTPDDLPILGESEVQGYFAATGHFRDGILLAPITAEVMTDLVMGKTPAHDLENFSLSRFHI